MMENLLYPASPDASQKCQLYAFYVPEKDLPAAQDRIPSLKVRGWELPVGARHAWGGMPAAAACCGCLLPAAAAQVLGAPDRAPYPLLLGAGCASRQWRSQEDFQDHPVRCACTT
jgi:hypothetical protein